MDPVVCCIALNEEPYICEFIDHHLSIGFSHVYVYDNSHNNALAHVITADRVTIVHFPGQAQQANAYHHFLHTFAHHHTHVAIIDCDEFIYLKQHKTIRDLLSEYSHAGALAINWVMFGSNNHKHYTDEPVVKRFTKCHKGSNKHTKWISRIDCVLALPHPHYSILHQGCCVDTNNTIVSGPYNQDGPIDVVQINHYFTKSYDEFKQKVERGVADSAIIKRSMAEFEQHDFAEIEDLGLFTQKSYNLK